MKKENTLQFISRYFNNTAPSCIHLENGDILYEGELGNAPARIMLNTRVKSFSGLGDRDDIMLCVEEI